MNLNQKAKETLTVYRLNPKVDTAFISGSVARNWQDAFSDIEIIVLWKVAPSEDDRKNPITVLHGEIVDFFPFEDDEWSETYICNGVKLEISNFLTETITAEGVQAIRSAIDSGYRLLDTAYNYENEATVGQAINQHGIAREEILVTSKLPGRYQKYDDAVTTIQESLYRAGLDYYDLYLIHWPNPKQDTYVEAWQALLDARKWGLIRSVGVCNFLPEHLDRLKAETGELPVINQIELHPFFNQEKQRQYHLENNIVTESWSPLGRKTNLLDHPMLAEIAENYDKTASQIVLRWHYQLGSIAIPKSATPSRQLENISIFDFELNQNDMEKINNLTLADGRIADQDPAVYEEF